MKSEQEIRKHLNDLTKIVETTPIESGGQRGYDMMITAIVIMGWVLQECPDHDRAVEKYNRIANEI